MLLGLFITMVFLAVILRQENRKPTHIQQSALDEERHQLAVDLEIDTAIVENIKNSKKKLV